MTQAVHARLAGHPANPARFDGRIDVTLTHLPDGGLAIAYAIHDCNVGLHIPTPHAPACADALWRSTCCEIFVGPAGQHDYREFNFSPSGQWAAYDFHDYRQRTPATPDCPAPAIRFMSDEHLLQLDVTLAPAALQIKSIESETLRLAAAVVLETRDGSFGYWAFAHPPGKPDFHHQAGFALKLGPRGFYS